MIAELEKPKQKSEGAKVLRDVSTADAFIIEDGTSLAQFKGPVQPQSTNSGKETYLAFVKRTLLELTNIKFALSSFVVNNLRRRYRRSVLGFAWSLLNPILTMCVMTAVFSMLFHQSVKTFGVYVFTGLLPWTFFIDSLMAGSSSITAAESFLKKVYIPKLFFPLVAVTTEGFNFAFSMIALTIIALVAGVQFTWNLLFVIPAALLLFTFCFSCALFCAIATIYFRDLAHILRVSLNALFYTVPIIYPTTLVPEHYRWIYAYHPLARFVELFRIPFCQGQIPSFDVWLAPLIVTSAMFALAFYTLKKTERDIIFRL